MKNADRPDRWGNGRLVVLIGGCRDGERHQVEEFAPTLIFHKQVGRTPFYFDVSASDQIAEFETEVYERQTFRDMSGEVYEAYVLAGVKNPFRLLLDGYKPKG